MKFLVLPAFFLFLVTGFSQAATVIYSLNATGAQEVPGPGDPDGLATGTISVNDTTGDISWNFTYSNIAAPTAMHIHSGAAGASGGVLVGLGVAGNGTDTLADSITTSTANASAINANPIDFYVNIHNGDFGAGALRGQLGTVVPEPSSALLFSLAGLLLFRRTKR